MMVNCTRTESHGRRRMAVSCVTVTRVMSTVRLRCVSSDVRTRENCLESAVQFVTVSLVCLETHTNARTYDPHMHAYMIIMMYILFNHNKTFVR